MAASSFSNSPINFYKEFEPRFITSMMNQFPAMRREDIEDLYQDTFIMVIRQFNEGKTTADTDWWAYIRKVGFNQMSKKLRGGVKSVVSIDDNDNAEGVSSNMLEMERVLNAAAEVEVSPLVKEEKYVAIETVLASLPEKVSGLINDKYYLNLSDKDLAQKWGYANSATVKAKRFQIMKKVKDMCACEVA